MYKIQKKYFVYHEKWWWVDLYSTTGFSSSQELFRSWRESWHQSRTRTSLQKRIEDIVIIVVVLARTTDQNQPAKKMLVFKIIWEYEAGDYHHLMFWLKMWGATDLDDKYT